MKSRIIKVKLLIKVDLKKTIPHLFSRDFFYYFGLKYLAYDL